MVVSKNKKIIRELLIAMLITVSMATFTGRKAAARAFGKETNEYDNEILNQPTRREIYKLIEENEGCHFRKICRVLDKKMGVVQYHIQVLERNGFIRSVREGRYKFFFPTHKGDRNAGMLKKFDLSREKRAFREKIIVAMGKETPRKILEYLIKNGEATHQKLAQISGISAQAITFHCKRLEADNFIYSEKVGRQKVYRLTDAVKELIPYL